MGWITSLLGFLDKLFGYLNAQTLKKAGKDELKVEEMGVINEKQKQADAIRNSTIDDDLLLPPDQRNK